MHKTRNVSELRTANRNGAFLCSTLRAKGLHSYPAQLAHSVPHTGTLSHYRSVSHTIPFVNRLSCIFCSPPRWTHLHYSSLHCVRTQQGRALTLEISSPATNSCSLQKNMQSVVVKEGGRKQILLPLEMLCHRGCAQGHHMDDLLNSCFFCSFEHKEQFL